jgi:hypothetical protein
MIEEAGYVDLGLACADVCRVLDRGLKERRADELNQPILEAIGSLNTWVEGDPTVACSVHNPFTILSIAGS